MHTFVQYDLTSSALCLCLQEALEVVVLQVRVTSSLPVVTSSLLNDDCPIINVIENVSHAADDNFAAADATVSPEHVRPQR